MRRLSFPQALVLLASTIALCACAFADDVAKKPLAHAHAHNDYLHKRPLLDALNHGFASVEADIFLVDGKLLVAHTQRELHPEKTLRSLYLDPLRERVRAGRGQVYADGGPFHLLIDIKSEAEPTYRALSKVLADYVDMISVVRDGKLEPRAIDVTVSGNRPRTLMESEKVRYAGCDGRMSDLDSDVAVDFMPLISDSWPSIFEWRGSGPLGDADRRKLKDTIDRAHAHGRKIRFWAAPDNPMAWHLLRDAGVDLINTDKLAELESFFTRRAATGSIRIPLRRHHDG